MKVGVIGAGISGLTTAYYLEKMGADVIVLEAKDAPGGAIKTVIRDSFLAEHGPHSILEKNASVGKLVEDLGLQDERIYANEKAKNRYVVRNGQVLPVPMSGGEFFKSPLLSGLAKLSLLKEPFLFPPDNSDDESVESFFVRRLGKEFMEYGADPMVNGIWAGDPKKLSIRHVFPKLYSFERDHRSIFAGAFAGRKNKSKVPQMFSFKRGNQVLTDALAASLKKVVTSAPVKSLVHQKGSWAIYYNEAGEGKMTRVDAVVLTIPTWAQEMIEIRHSSGTFNPKPPQPVHHPPVSVVTLAYQEKNVEHPLDGFGVLVPNIEKRRILGTLFSSSLFPHRSPNGHVVFSTFVGGARHPELTTLPVKERVDIVREELETLLGATGRPTFAYEYLAPRAIPQYDVGYGRNLVAYHQMESRCPGLFFGGSFRDGVAVADLVEAAVDNANRIRKFSE